MPSHIVLVNSLMTEHLTETKHKGMRSKPRLKEKQGKEARTSQIYGTLGGTWRSNSTGRGIPRPAGAPDICQHRAGRQSTIVVAEKLTIRRQATEMNMVSLRDSLADVLHTLLYVGGAQQ